MQKDYFLKAQVLNSGLAKLQSQFSKYIFLFNKCYDDPKATYKDYDNFNSLIELKRIVEHIHNEAIIRFGVDLTNMQDYLVLEAIKINRATYERNRRLYVKIADMLKKPCVFLTITFKPGVYESTSDITKRRYVARCLKQLGVPYIANVDYGSKNDRLHYHAIVQIEKIPFDIWDYGNIDAKKVTIPNEKALAKYINKLTNHAIKETCKGNRLLYSRGF